MSQTAATGELELVVSDFGPIARAKVDLRPLTVFIGPSNTGKSWLATLVYALHRYFVRGHPFFPRHPVFRFPKRNQAAGAAADALANETGSRRTVPPVLAAELAGGIDAGVDALEAEIRRCYGIDTAKALVRHRKTTGARIGWQSTTGHARFELTLSGDRSELRTSLADDQPLVLDAVNLPMPPGADTGPGPTADALAQIGELVLSRLVGVLHRPAFHLPADRGGVMHTHDLLTRAAIGRAAGGPELNAPSLSGTVADYLAELIEVDRPGRPGAGDASAAAEIEDGLLGGSISVERSELIGYPRFLYQPKGWRQPLPFTIASSMVAELAPLVLFLRHVVAPGDTLIVDEPEAHLHPAMQVELTRQLAEVVNAGVRVLVTTHSEWLVEELANVVRRSKLPASERARVSGSSVALDPGQVGAWLFEPKKSPKGSVVTEVPLDEYGFNGTGFDDVASALHNDWADMSGRIEGIP